MSAAGAEHVEADAADDGGQPGAHVFDAVDLRGRGAQPGVLHRIFGIVERTEHAIGHPAQVWAVELELLGKGIDLGHWSHSSVLACHHYEPSERGNVTLRTRRKGAF